MVSAIGEIKRGSGEPQLTETFEYSTVEVNRKTSFQSDVEIDLDQRAELPSVLGWKQQNLRDCCLHRASANCQHEYKV